jgi:hypothetical protein
MYKDLVEEGKLRSDVPIERMLDTLGNMLYGTMFTNLFIGRSVSLDEQFNAIYEIALRGITRMNSDQLESPTDNSPV